ETILELTKHPIDDVRAAALGSFSELGPHTRAVAPLLIQATQTEQDEDVLGALADALGEIGAAAPESLPALVRLLDDKRWFVQSNVIDALEKFGELAVGPLSEALTSDSAEVRATAASALGNLGDKAVGVVPQLVSLLKDRSSEVRRQVIFSLGQIGVEDPAELAPQIVPALIPLLNDKDKEIRRTASNSLHRFGPEGKEALPALIN